MVTMLWEDFDWLICVTWYRIMLCDRLILWWPWTEIDGHHHNSLVSHHLKKGVTMLSRWWPVSEGFDPFGALYNRQWASNIGNGFFNIPINLHPLKRNPKAILRNKIKRPFRDSKLVWQLFLPIILLYIEFPLTYALFKRNSGVKVP